MELIRTSANQLNLKYLSQIQDSILADTKYYSPARDLDALLFQSPDEKDNILNIYAESAFLNNKTFASPETAEVFEKLMINDSLNKIIELKEDEFDSIQNQ